jgi:hypothetical protein
MKRALGLAAAFLLIGSFATAQDVSYNFDQQADFSKFKTYKWVAVKDQEKLDELTMKQINSAIEKQLAAKGLTLATGGTADLFVAYQVAVSKEKELQTWDTGYSMGPGWGGGYRGGYYGGGYGGGMSTSTTSTIYIGSVAFDMYDAATKKLVWRSLASKQIDTKANPEKRQKNLDKGMAKMMKNYPPKVKK